MHGIDGLAEQVDARQSNALTQLGVNPLREVVGRGRQVWGARVLAAPDTTGPGRYLHVRRLTDHVLTSLTAGLAFVQDEPSDAALWLRVRARTEDFLLELWRRGALQGSRPEQAYFARCGPGETMTQADVASGMVVLMVGLAPLRPAEFDVHTLRLQAGMPSGDDHAVDLDRVVSRHIGETEKNLSRIFDRAKHSGEVLVFDEADALFGKRTQVRDAHDKYADQEISSLIAKMARDHGVPVRWRRTRPPPPP